MGFEIIRRYRLLTHIEEMGASYTIGTWMRVLDDVDAICCDIIVLGAHQDNERAKVTKPSLLSSIPRHLRM